MSANPPPYSAHTVPADQLQPGLYDEIQPQPTGSLPEGPPPEYSEVNPNDQKFAGEQKSASAGFNFSSVAQYPGDPNYGNCYYSSPGGAGVGQQYPGAMHGYNNQAYTAPAGQLAIGDLVITSGPAPGHHAAPIITPVTQRPESYMGLSIFACIFCCWPLGIAAIINANQSQTASQNGNYFAAANHSRTARTLSFIAILFGIFIIITTSVRISIMFSSDGDY